MEDEKIIDEDGKNRKEYHNHPKSIVMEKDQITSEGKALTLLCWTQIAQSKESPQETLAST